MSLKQHCSVIEEMWKESLLGSRAHGGNRALFKLVEGSRGSFLFLKPLITHLHMFYFPLHRHTVHNVESHLIICWGGHCVETDVNFHKWYVCEVLFLETMENKEKPQTVRSITSHKATHFIFLIIILFTLWLHVFHRNDAFLGLPNEISYIQLKKKKNTLMQCT